MKSLLREVDHNGLIYPCLMFVCPGCLTFHDDGTGLHMLPVNTDKKEPSWTWDGNLELPTLSPSIRTRFKILDVEQICHSFLVAGVFQFLSDCTHSLKDQYVDIPDLPDWVLP